METSSSLFIGMLTWDVVYLADKTPTENEKMMAREMTFSAGGPAANAAITFTALGGSPKLVASCGASPIAGLIKEDLRQHKVDLMDLNPKQTTPPPVSSIVINSQNGARTVVSVKANQGDFQAQKHSESEWWRGLNNPPLILADGHQPQAAVLAKRRFPSSPLILDCGSWREGFYDLFPFADFAICSEHFRPPGCDTTEEVLRCLGDMGVEHVAVSRGEQPIEVLSPDGRGAIEVPSVAAVDTLGAGDVLHGAFCNYLLEHGFLSALQKAAKVASFSCGFFGTRAWISRWPS